LLQSPRAWALSVSNPANQKSAAAREERFMVFAPPEMVKVNQNRDPAKQKQRKSRAGGCAQMRTEAYLSRTTRKLVFRQTGADHG
jgi:hypothetical protein